MLPPSVAPMATGCQILSARQRVIMSTMMMLMAHQLQQQPVSWKDSAQQQQHHHQQHQLQPREWGSPLHWLQKWRLTAQMLANRGSGCRFMFPSAESSGLLSDRGFFPQNTGISKHGPKLEPLLGGDLVSTATPCSGSTRPGSQLSSVSSSSVCVLCGRIFRFEKNLLRHLERSHSAAERESLLKCKLCQYTTRHYSNMYVHIRTHTGDKPYYCSACGAAFTQGSSLKLHIKSRHHDNMCFFALSRKPRKSNLTKLWSRVYKSDLGQVSPLSLLPPPASAIRSSANEFLAPQLTTFLRPLPLPPLSHYLHQVESTRPCIEEASSSIFGEQRSSKETIRHSVSSMID